MAEEKTENLMKKFIKHLSTGKSVYKTVNCKDCKEELIISKIFTGNNGKLMQLTRSNMGLLAKGAVSDHPSGIKKFVSNNRYDKNLMGEISKFEKDQIYRYVLSYNYPGKKKPFVVKFKTSEPVVGFFCSLIDSEQDDKQMIALAFTQNHVYNILDSGRSCKISSIDLSYAENDIGSIARHIVTGISDYYAEGSEEESEEESDESE